MNLPAVLITVRSALYVDLMLAFCLPLFALAVDGRANARLFALGPLTRGAFWEIVAVPDIRQQVWRVARALAQTQWVGGEGL